MDYEFWQSIIEDDYRFPEGDSYSLTDLTIELLNYISLTDPTYRDKFAYGILARWITLYNYHEADDLHAMLDWLIPQMTAGLGESDTDSVFQRSYANLILSLIVYRDYQVNFMTESEVKALLDKARHCLTSERDLRAYVPEKGWANAAAHTCDLLRFLARSGHLEGSDLRRLLDSITDKVTTSTTTIFHHDEDDRLAQVTIAVLRRDMLTLYELSDWLSRFFAWKQSQPNTPSYDEAYHATYQNIRNYLRSLYCRMDFVNNLPVDAQDFQATLLKAVHYYSV